MTLLWLCFIIFLVYYAFLLATNLLAYPRLIAALNSGAMKRTSLYLQMMAGLWIPALAVLMLVAFGQFSLNNVGLAFRDFSCPQWVRITSIVLASAYFLFLLTQNIVLRRNAKKEIQNNQEIPERLRAMLPVSRQEKRMWAAAAITAGVAEELLFRGFLLHVLTALFPALPLLAALGIATLLFGAGHLYQGAGEAVKPLLLGLLFGVFYIAFGTILPCIVLHAMQDLEAGWVNVEK
jgi:uncharacterized protein